MSAGPKEPPLMILRTEDVLPRPRLRGTYTYVHLEVSQAAYDEIAQKLRAVGYDHAFVPARTEIEGVQAEREPAIDMHGIALVLEDAEYKALFVEAEFKGWSRQRADGQDPFGKDAWMRYWRAKQDYEREIAAGHPDPGRPVPPHRSG